MQREVPQWNSESDLQKMSDEELNALWASKPAFGSNTSDWLLVAKEVRHRQRFAKPR